MYVYNQEVMFSTTLPVYQTFKQGPGYAIYTCKTKTTRNPIYKWTIGAHQTSVASSNGSSAGGNTGAGVAGCGVAINEFAFSPCGHFLCVVSADGYLRVFNYDAMELVGTGRSYFGGLLCCCWSPDGKVVNKLLTICFSNYILKHFDFYILIFTLIFFIFIVSKSILLWAGKMIS